MRFAHIAKDLQVRKLPENIRIVNSPESVDNLDNNDEIPNESIHKDNEDQAEYELFISDKSKSRMGLYLHTSSAHECIRYSCKFCKYKARYKSNLKRHQEAIHEGVKYSCDQCDYHAKTRSDLKRHKNRFMKV